MDCKPYQPLSKVKHEVDLTYTSSSDESEDGGKQRQSYDSRETLNEYSQELRLNYNSHSRKRKTIDQSSQGKLFILSTFYLVFVSTFWLLPMKQYHAVSRHATSCFHRLVAITHVLPIFNHTVVSEIWEVVFLKKNCFSSRLDSLVFMIQ